MTAFNRAAEHANRVHQPEFARSLGFRGGIVPGVDVFAYMAAPVSARWGLDWLRGGGLEARFAKPVVDGDELTVRARVDGDRIELEAGNQLGEVCATGVAERATGEPAPDPAQWPAPPLPDRRPPASPEAFQASPALGALEVAFTAEAARDQLDEVREPLAAYAETGTVHPGHLLRLADALLSANVELPPWMHVSSRARFLAPVRWGDTLSVRGRRVGLFERKGHLFVQVDVLALRDGEPVFRVAPYTAIYRPAFHA